MLEYKKCKECKEIKHFREFYFQLSRCGNDDLSSRCKDCQRVNRMIDGARSRARKRGLPFNLVKKDIIIPEICPVLGILIKHNSRHIGDNSPTIDRINNDKGYTKDNIVVISMKANRLKSNASLEELQQIAEFYKKYHKKEKKFLTFWKKLVQLKN